MNTVAHYYRIAGLWISILLPEAWEADTLLPSFCPFRQDRCEEGHQLLTAVVRLQEGDNQGEASGTPIEETYNDMGCIRLYVTPDGYRVLLSTGADGVLHVMQANKDFTDIRILLSPKGDELGQRLSSLLRIAYSQAILYHEGISLHASAVYRENQAFLFMGKSGTGKSTHAALWMKHIPGTRLLNDDNPTVRIIDDKAYAYGTPWSGKTSCYKDLSFPIGGMVRLRQCTHNKYYSQEGAKAFVTLFPGCSVICQDESLRSHLYDTVSRLAETVPIGMLDCLPDKEAALLCQKALHEAHDTMRNQ